MIWLRSGLASRLPCQPGSYPFGCSSRHILCRGDSRVCGRERLGPSSGGLGRTAALVSCALHVFYFHHTRPLAFGAPVTCLPLEVTHHQQGARCSTRWEPACQRVEGLTEGPRFSQLGCPVLRRAAAGCWPRGVTVGPWCRPCTCSKGLCWPGPQVQLCPSPLAQIFLWPCHRHTQCSALALSPFSLYTPLARANQAPFWSHTGLCPC